MRRGKARWLLLAALLAGAPPLAAVAQSVGGCDAPEVSARNNHPPRTETIRDFAGGAVRVVALDTGEPAAAGEPFSRCTPISAAIDLGAAGRGIAAREDRARVLILERPAQRPGGADAPAQPAPGLSVERDRGAVIAVLRARGGGPVGGRK